MVILKRRQRTKLTLPPLRTCVWGVQTTEDHNLRPHWTGEPAQDSRANLCTHATMSETRTFDPRVPLSGRSAHNTAYECAHLNKNASEPPKIMGWLHRADKCEHRGAHSIRHGDGQRSKHMSQRLQRAQQRGPPQIQLNRHAEASKSTGPCSFR